MGCKCLRRYGTLYGLLEIEHIHILLYPQSIQGHTYDTTIHKPTELQSHPAFKTNITKCILNFYSK